MITAVVGSGGKTTLIHKLADEYKKAGKTVCVMTTTHMYIENDTLLTDDPDIIINHIKKHGYAMAGIKCGNKITALSSDTYNKVCDFTDEILIEADGSKHLPLKYPIDTEPVIPANIDRIYVVCGISALGKKSEDVIFRYDEAQKILGFDSDTIVTPLLIQNLLRKGYLNKLMNNKEIKIVATHDDSLYSRVIASLIEADMDVSIIDEKWFAPKPCLFICGGGHVAKQLADMASLLDFRIKLIDSREEFATKDRYPYAEQVICDDFGNLNSYLEKDSFYVIVTPGHADDYICASKILDSQYKYLGMIGSKGKVMKTFDKLRENGFSDELISTIHAPIGLKIGAATPAEIAVSILAEVILEKNKTSFSSISQTLLNSTESGVLCIIIDKTGSTPRGIGSMMLVTKNGQIDTIGGGAIENAALLDAKTTTTPTIREYNLSEADTKKLGMICGGTNKILFIPV